MGGDVTQVQAIVGKLGRVTALPDGSFLFTPVRWLPRRLANRWAARRLRTRKVT